MYIFTYDYDNRNTVLKQCGEMLFFSFWEHYFVCKINNKSNRKVGINESTTEISEYINNSQLIY